MLPSKKFKQISFHLRENGCSKIISSLQTRLSFALNIISFIYSVVAIVFNTIWFQSIYGKEVKKTNNNDAYNMIVVFIKMNQFNVI